MTKRLTVSVEEAGRMLGISRGLAYDLVARGEIPAVRLGRRLVVPRRALESMLEVAQPADLDAVEPASPQPLHTPRRRPTPRSDGSLPFPA